MGNVEKYGLLALFVLCALIVGVGVFGDDGKVRADWTPPVAKQESAQSSMTLDNLARRDEPERAARGTAEPEARPQGGLVPVPPPDRTRSFPRGDQPVVLTPDVETKPSAAPAPKKKQTAAKAPRLKRVRVRDGDTLTAIALRSLGSKSRSAIAALRQANPGISDRALAIGTYLVVPQGWTAKQGVSRKHRVRPGDTLSEISTRYYKTARYWKKLARANGLDPEAPLGLDLVLDIPPLAKASQGKAKPK